MDLGAWPVQTCWPDDAGPLITWALVITRGPHGGRQNLGIYRQQVIARNRVIMRWLAHRGGALDYRAWREARPGEPFPVAVALGADPATTLAAVTPIPDSLSEYAFAGLLRGGRTEVAQAIGSDLQVPASAEVVLEGAIHPGDEAPEGPFGDHTGYYNDVETFPVFTIDRITHRRDPIFHSTYTGRPPDEPAVLGAAMNELFIPLLRRQFPEIRDFYLPPEGCSYRIGIVSMKKEFAGHAKRVMFGLWSVLRQFMYTKIVIVVDEDIDARTGRTWRGRLRRGRTRSATSPSSRTPRSTTWTSPPRSPDSAPRWASTRPESGPERRTEPGAGPSSWGGRSSNGSTRCGRASASPSRRRPAAGSARRLTPRPCVPSLVNRKAAASLHLRPYEAKGLILAVETEAKRVILAIEAIQAWDQLLLDPLRRALRSVLCSAFRSVLRAALRSLVQARLQGIGQTFDRTGSFHVHILRVRVCVHDHHVRCVRRSIDRLRIVWRDDFRVSRGR